MSFSGLAANFGGVPLAFAFIATLGHTGFISVFLNQICFSSPAGTRTCPFDIYKAGFNLYSLAGLTLCYLYFQFPLMVLTIAPALEGLKREWREASENLGGSSVQYWWNVALPILWPSILGSSILLFASAFGAYATAEALTGGFINLVTILIGDEIRGDVLNNPNEGYALALGMIVVMAVCVAAYTILQRQNSTMDKIMKTKNMNLWALLWAILGMLYFFVPLYGTFDFSLRMQKGVLRFHCLSSCLIGSSISGKFPIFSHDGHHNNDCKCSHFPPYGLLDVHPPAPSPASS